MLTCSYKTFGIAKKLVLILCQSVHILGCTVYKQKGAQRSVTKFIRGHDTVLLKQEVAKIQQHGR